MSDWLFDAQGLKWPVGNPSLRARLCVAISAADFGTYAVKNLGFARISDRQHGTRLWVRPQSVVAPALAGLLVHVSEFARSRIVLSWFEQEWHNEILADRYAAIERINTLTDRARAQRDNRFHRRTVDPHNLARNHPLASILAKWSEVSAHWSPQLIEALLQPLGNGRYAMAVEEPGSGRLRLISCGPGYERVAKHWIDRSEGLNLEDQADYAFGIWVADAYRQVARSGIPGLDAVNATLRWPNNRTRHYRYLRLLVPFKCGGRTIVLSTSVADDPLVERVELFDKVS